MLYPDVRIGQPPLAAIPNSVRGAEAGERSVLFLASSAAEAGIRGTGVRDGGFHGLVGNVFVGAGGGIVGV